MTRDEKEQIKKDTLWKIHQCNQEIACLERKVSDTVDAMKILVEAWEKEMLGADSGHLLWRGEGDRPTERLKIPTGAFAETIETWEKTKKRRDDLQRSFDRM